MGALDGPDSPCPDSARGTRMILGRKPTKKGIQALLFQDLNTSGGNTPAQVTGHHHSVKNFPLPNGLRSILRTRERFAGSLLNTAGFAWCRVRRFLVQSLFVSLATKTQRHKDLVTLRVFVAHEKRQVE